MNHRLCENLIVTPFVLLGDDGTIKNELTERIYTKLGDAQRQVLTYCHVARSYHELSSLVSIEQLDYLIAERLLTKPESIWRLSDIRSVEIEVTTHCNWRCRYCPVHDSPHPPKIMPQQLFREIVDKMCRHGSIRSVSINSYNEPTLDPYFDERIKHLQEAGLKLRLHTNASILPFNRLEYLSKLGVLENVFFNVPTLRPEKFVSLTGRSKRYLDLLRQSIENALALDLSIGFSIQSLPEVAEKTKADLSDWLGIRFTSDMVANWPRTDRAGLLKNEFALHVKNDEPLSGCGDLLHWLYIGVSGECYMCCEDYHHRTAYANIQDGEISEITASEKMALLRRQVFGFMPTPESFPCRSCAIMRQQKYANIKWQRAIDLQAHNSNE